MTCRRELWAAEQALLRLQRKLETLPGWRASMAWEAVESAINELMGQGMWDAHHAQSMPRGFKHWREKYPDVEVL
jgi:hypothetical protein